MPGPSGYQVGISSALTLNATKTVQESTAQQPLTLFQGASIQGGTFNISVNALNESHFDGPGIRQGPKKHVTLLLNQTVTK